MTRIQETFFSALITLAGIAPVVAEVTRPVEINTGTIQGAHYTIARPGHWNGNLLMVAHGHRFENQDLDGSLNVDNGVYANLLAEGWIIATSSYRRNGIIVHDAIEDLDLLKQYIGETHGKPARTLLMGDSMGGAIGTLIAESASEGYDGILAIGAALRLRDPKNIYTLNYQPRIPVLFLSNQSEIAGPEIYVEKAEAVSIAPALWRVDRDGHVNVNDAEREAALRALDHFVETGEIERRGNGTISGSYLRSTAEVTETAAIARITSVSANFGNIFTGFVGADLEKLGLRQGSQFTLKLDEQEIPVLWGVNYRDVDPGEWVAFISAEGNLMMAVNTGNACNAISCKVGDELTLLP